MIDPRLAEIVREYNSALPESSKRIQQLELLCEQDTSAVLTGQQVGLYLSPVLALYKALTAVAVAEYQQATSKRPCVPIFWLQSEDHDFDEISSASIPAQNGELVDLPLTGGGQGSAVQHHTLGEEIVRLNQQLAEHLAEYEFAAQTMELVQRHYKPGVSIVDAFAGLLAELTSEFGLIIFNPRSSGVAPLMQPLFQSALARYQELAAMLLPRGGETTSGSQAALVHVRDNSPLFFYHSDSSTGPRHRLLWDADKQWFSIHGTDQQLREEELRACLEAEPERFSSSALLRPIVQDALFPTEVIVAGPTEQAYLQQVAPLYAEFRLVQPQIRARPSLYLLEPKSQKLLQELDLRIADLAGGEDEVLAKLAEDDSANWLSPQSLSAHVETTLTPLWQLLRENVTALDSTLVRPLEKTSSNVEKLLDRFLERYTSAAGSRDEITVRRVKLLGELLQPRGQAQERTISTMYYFAKYGPEMINSVYRAIDAFVKNPSDGRALEVAL